MRLRGLFVRVRGLLRGRHWDQDLRDQIEGHLEEATEEYLRQGLPPAEARRAARLDFGGVVVVEEECRDVRGGWLRDVAKDIRHGLRSLGRNPVFTTVAILSLAVGIGANVVVFSIMNSFLLRPRPVSNPDRFVELYVGDREHPYETCSHPSFLDLRAGNGVLTGLAASSIRQFKLTEGGQVEQVWGEVVSADYFDVLGVPPEKGRAFVAGAAAATGGVPEVVIGHALWRRRFDSDPNLIGRDITINGQKLTVVGIAPERYTGMLRGLSSEVWVPISMFPVLEPAKVAQEYLTNRGARWLTLLGRLGPGTDVEQVRARFSLLSRQMQATHPEEWASIDGKTGRVRELFVSVLRERESRVHPGMQADAFAAGALLLVVVNIVLLIACMNLAGMLLARGVARRKEIAIRQALGGSRWRLIRMLLAESILLSLMAGAAGVVLTVWLLSLVVAFMPAFPEGLHLALDLRLDGRVLAFAMLVSTVTGILFGLVPAWQTSKPDVSAVLKDDSTTATSTYRRSRGRRALIVAQVAFSLLLLIGAGLVFRSQERLSPARLGFSSDHILVVPVVLEETRYDRRKSQEYYRQLAERVSSLPGVQAVSFVEGMPGGFMSRSRRSTEIEGYEPNPQESLEIDASLVGPRYFTNMRVPVVQGRDFDERDREGAPCVAIVNEAFTRRYLRGAGTALGKHLAKFEEDSIPQKQMCEIVGVIHDDAWQSLQKTVQPFYALALQQSYRTRMSLLVHTEGDPASQSHAVSRVVRELDPDMPTNDIQTLREHFSATIYPFRLMGIVLGACGFVALLLAAVGIYGIVSYAAAQRTREVGIRISLGAMKSDILKMVVGEGMRLVVIGLALGVLLSAALTRVLASSWFETDMLFGVSATDPMTFAGVTLVLALVAAVACLVPALRATRLDPIVALRAE